MKNFKKIALGVLIVFLFTGFATVAEGAPQHRFRFAGQHAIDHPATMMMNDVAREINERTEGRVEVTVFPASQLGNWSQVMQELIQGTIDMSLTSFATDFDPRFGVLYMNGLVLSYDQARAVFQPDAWLLQKLDYLASNLRVRVLGVYLEGMIGLGSTQPLTDPLNPAVDKGVMTRVPGMEVFITGAHAMGFRTVTIPWPDIFFAIQTGTADAVIGLAAPTAYTMLGDLLSYWYVLNYSMESHPFMVSMSSWDQLSPEDQQIFAEIGRDFTLRSVAAAEQDDNRFLGYMEARGIQVHRFTEAELQPIKEVLIASWDGLIGSMGQEFIDEIRGEFGGN
jgi:TRAP-type C4-dicarboxylate transport system substrate-binding protein